MSQRSKFFKKIAIICASVVALSAFAILIHSDYQQEKQYETEQNERGRLFIHSYENPADIYGLANENNILGEPISEILEGYVEKEDYIVSSNEYFISYTFEMIDDYYGNQNANLIIYTPANDSFVDSVQYQFKENIGNTNSAHLKLIRINNNETAYYDVDPSYTYVNDNNDIINIDKDTFYSLIQNDYKSLYNISWKSPKGNALILIQNLNDEATDFCSISFTQD